MVKPFISYIFYKYEGFGQLTRFHFLRLLTILLALVLTGGHDKAGGSSGSIAKHNMPKHSPGIQCKPYLETTPQGPRNYSVAEIGNPGIPKLTRRQLKSISSIKQYISSPFLRFAFVSDELIVFDAVDGPCFDGGAPGYPVLNGDCNEYYQPGEDPRTTVAAPGCIGPPRPWIPSDKGLPGDPRIWSRKHQKTDKRL